MVLVKSNLVKSDFKKDGCETGDWKREVRGGGVIYLGMVVKSGESR